LSLPVSFDPALSAEVEKFTRKIIGTNADAEMQKLARHIAETQIDLHRVRSARHQLLSQALSDPDYESEAMHRKKAALAIRILRRFDSRTPMPDKRDGSSEFEAGGAEQARNYPRGQDSSVARP
jgi:hypothetical protein